MEFKQRLESMGLKIDECAYCGRGLQFTNPKGKRFFNLEHVDSFSSDAARHTVDNVLPACRACNAAKSSRRGVEYVIDRPEELRGIRADIPVDKHGVALVAPVVFWVTDSE